MYWCVDVWRTTRSERRREEMKGSVQEGQRDRGGRRRYRMRHDMKERESQGGRRLEQQQVEKHQNDIRAGGCNMHCTANKSSQRANFKDGSKKRNSE